MQSRKCDVDNCHAQAVIGTYAVWRRKIKYVAAYCECHASVFWENHAKAPLSGDHDLRRKPRDGEFDIEVVAIDYRPNYPCCVVLREVHGNRKLDIQTGVFECSALQRELEGIPAPRPLTHDLVLNVISAFGGKLVCVKIDKNKHDDVYYRAELEIEGGKHTIKMDSRPSDAIVLAVKASVPLLISAELQSSIIENTV
jgi:bifunctional DNase/RNase